MGIIYLNSSYFIQSQQWKYGEGAHIGDWLEKDSFDINDRIIYSYAGKANIVFCFGKYLYIENMNTKESGLYINKI